MPIKIYKEQPNKLTFGSTMKRSKLFIEKEASLTFIWLIQNAVVTFAKCLKLENFRLYDQYGECFPVTSGFYKIVGGIYLAARNSIIMTLKESK